MTLGSVSDSWYLELVTLIVTLIISLIVVTFLVVTLIEESGSSTCGNTALISQAHVVF